MERHNEKREYPFPYTVGDCNKKFARKADLQRHHQSGSVPTSAIIAADYSRERMH